MKTNYQARYIEAKAVLMELASTIEATGGVYRNADGGWSPNGDPEWWDLADVYRAACKVLKRKKMLTNKTKVAPDEVPQEGTKIEDQEDPE